MPIKLKETNISNEHSRLKNPNWQEADQLAFYKHDRGVELGSTEKQLQISGQSGPPDFKSGALTTRSTLGHAAPAVIRFGSRGPWRKVWDTSPKSIACEGLGESRTRTIHFRASEEKQNGFAGMLSLARRTGGLAGPAWYKNARA